MKATNANFHPMHRAMLERYAAGGCLVSAHMLKTGLGFPEAVEELHRLRCAEPVPVPVDGED